MLLEVGWEIKLLNFNYFFQFRRGTCLILFIVQEEFWKIVNKSNLTCFGVFSVKKSFKIFMRVVFDCWQMEEGGKSDSAVWKPSEKTDDAGQKSCFDKSKLLKTIFRGGKWREEMWKWDFNRRRLVSELNWTLLIERWTNRRRKLLFEHSIFYFLEQEMKMWRKHCKIYKMSKVKIRGPAEAHWNTQS